MRRGKTDLSIFDNSWYKPGGRLKRIIWYFTNLLFFRSGWFPFSGCKVFLLRLFGARIGKQVIIKPAVNIKYPWNITLGDHVWIGEHVWIDSLGPVEIGDHVCISQGALILSGNHNYKSPAFDLIIRKIIIEDGVWIGARSVVCQGVRCGNHAVLSVMSVARSDLQPYGVYGGNPAVKIRERVIT